MTQLHPARRRLLRPAARRAARQRHPRPGLPGPAPTTTTRQPPRTPSPVTASRAATSWSAAGRSPAPGTPASSSATNGRTGTARCTRPVTGFASQVYGTTLPGARRGRRPVRHRPDALAVPPVERLHARPEPGRQRRHHPQRGRAAGGLRRARRAQGRGGGDRAVDAGGSWRWCRPRRTTPARCRGTTAATAGPGPG